MAQDIIDIAKASVIAYNEKNWNAAETALSPEIIYEEMATQRKPKGIRDVLAAWRGWAEAFPDSKATFQNALASGNTVVLEMTWRGKHTGPLQIPGGGPLPPTGKSIEIQACQILDVEGTKAKRIRHYFDLATLLKQLGAEIQTKQVAEKR
jgi:steroid delta-isomerase-like uncharacterized protein